MEKSKAFQFNKDDILKIFKGTALAMGGAGVIYILGILDTINVDAYSPLYVALASSILNVLKVWLTGQTK